jgi:hypothetical protein
MDADTPASIRNLHNQHQPRILSKVKPVENSPLVMPGEAEQASSNPRKRKKSDANNSATTGMSLPIHGQPLASTSSGLQAALPLITPRTPRSAFSTAEEEVEMKRFNGASGLSNHFADPDDDKDEVDGLLGRRKKASTLSLKDKQAIVLLIILCA